MSSFLENKTIVITGAAKGLGRGLAKFFHQAGASVVVHYNQSHVAAEELRAELGERCSIYQADLKNQEDIKRLFAEIYQDQGRVDILINTVGTFIHKPFAEVTEEELADVLQTNIQATFACSKAVLPAMIEQGYGQIINIGCAGADRMPIKEHTTPYYMAKVGVIMLTKAMAKTYASQGIQVNCVSPGILENSIASVSAIPAGREGTFEDIAEAIRYLLSPEAAYCNGANIEVAGGWTP